MTLEYPLLLLLFPLLLFCLKLCQERNEAIIFPHLHLLQDSKKRSLSLLYLKYLILLLVLLALASPVKRELALETRSGYSEVLIFDVSDSMRERLRDRTQKFETAKRVCNTFIQKRENDFIGLTVFGEYAYIASPLTDDKELLGDILQSIYIGVAGKKTAIYDALFLTAKHFAKIDTKHKIAILLTDGQDTASRITQEAALRALQKYAIKVHTIGLGEENRYDRALLEKIAQRSGGKFFTANDAGMLEEVYAYIDELEKSDIEKKEYLLSYYYDYPLFAAVMVLLWYIYLRNKRSV
jgi:Ca-activated chloride channel family protein